MKFDRDNVVPGQLLVSTCHSHRVWNAEGRQVDPPVFTMCRHDMCLCISQSFEYGEGAAFFVFVNGIVGQVFCSDNDCFWILED